MPAAPNFALALLCADHIYVETGFHKAGFGS